MAQRHAMDGDAGAVSQRRPHRLFWLIDSLTMGGAETLVVPFARAARDRGVELTVCARTTIDGNPLEEELRSAGVRVENLGARMLVDFAAMRRLLTLVKELRPDILHAHLSYASIWGAVVARWRHIPFLASLHVPPVTGAGLHESIRQNLMVRLLNRYAARVIMVSSELGDLWRAKTRLDGSKIAIVHNGIEIAGLSKSRRERMRGELRIGSEAPVVATVAVLRPDKGIDILLESAAAVPEARPDCVFVIVGDGPMGEEWRRLADALGISDSVRWTGFRRDVSAILAGADLFVLPTLADAFPTVLLEALAAGIPVVASDVGGVPEIVEEGLTGRLTPPGDRKVLAATIIGALQDAEWRKRAGAAARERAERDFSNHAWFSRLDELYSTVLDERSVDREEAQ